MKKLITMGVAGLALLSLAACSSTKKVDNGDGAKKSSKVVASSSKKTSANQEVTNGSPEKVGQWKYMSDFDANGTLKKVTTLNKQVKQGDLTVTFSNIKIYSMKPKNADAKKIATTYFGASGVNDPYFVVQINWTAKNNGSKEVQTNGIDSVVTNTGQQLNANAGLQDSGVGSTIQPNATSDFEANGLLKGATNRNISKLTVKLSNTANTDTYEEVSPAISNIVLSFE